MYIHTHIYIYIYTYFYIYAPHKKVGFDLVTGVGETILENTNKYMVTYTCIINVCTHPKIGGLQLG